MAAFAKVPAQRKVALAERSHSLHVRDLNSEREQVGIRGELDF